MHGKGRERLPLQIQAQEQLIVPPQIARGARYNDFRY